MALGDFLSEKVYERKETTKLKFSILVEYTILFILSLEENLTINYQETLIPDNQITKVCRVSQKNNQAK